MLTHYETKSSDDSKEMFFLIYWDNIKEDEARKALTNQFQKSSNLKELLDYLGEAFILLRKSLRGNEDTDYINNSEYVSPKYRGSIWDMVPIDPSKRNFATQRFVYFVTVMCEEPEAALGLVQKLVEIRESKSPNIDFSYAEISSMAKRIKLPAEIERSKRYYIEVANVTGKQTHFPKGLINLSMEYTAMLESEMSFFSAGKEKELFDGYEAANLRL